MTYVAPLHFAVENGSTAASDRDVAYWAEACRLQLFRHVCPIWNLRDAPGVAVYPKGSTFPDNTALVCRVVDDIGEQAILGEHGLVGSTPWVLVSSDPRDNPSVVLSHELCETTVNQYLDRRTGDLLIKGDRYRYPLEICDPVEAQSYKLPVDMGDGGREVEVSNFVNSAWFDPSSHETEFDFLGNLKAPLELADGGYAAPWLNGEVVFVTAGMVRLPRRKLAPWARLSRLVAKGTATS